MFLENTFQPKPLTYNVPRKVLYLKISFLGHHSIQLSKQLHQLVTDICPYLKIKSIFINPLNISKLFSFKDKIPNGLLSKLIYMWTCPKCEVGKYIGCTTRHLATKIAEHAAKSVRTNKPIHSAIRFHSINCKTDINFNDLKILKSDQNKQNLLLYESLLIRI